MRVILFRHARVAMAKLLGYNVYWYAFIARIEPCLWRSNMPEVGDPHRGELGIRDLVNNAPRVGRRIPSSIGCLHSLTSPGPY